MVDAGAILKLRKANLDVGSSSQGSLANRSEGHLQILGTPQRQRLCHLVPQRVDRQGQFRSGDQSAAGRLGRDRFPQRHRHCRRSRLLERQGIFLNYVNHADISYGGGFVVVNSQSKAFAPIHTIVARPNVTFNTFTNSKDAAISVDQLSFADNKFEFQSGGVINTTNGANVAGHDRRRPWPGDRQPRAHQRRGGQCGHRGQRRVHRNGHRATDLHHRRRPAAGSTRRRKPTAGNGSPAPAAIPSASSPTTSASVRTCAATSSRRQEHGGLQRDLRTSATRRLARPSASPPTTRTGCRAARWCASPACRGPQARMPTASSTSPSPASTRSR